MSVTRCPNCDHLIGQFNKGSLTKRIGELLEVEGPLTLPEISLMLHASDTGVKKALHRLRDKNVIASSPIPGAVNGLAGARQKWQLV